MTPTSSISFISTRECSLSWGVCLDEEVLCLLLLDVKDDELDEWDDQELSLSVFASITTAGLISSSSVVVLTELLEELDETEELVFTWLTFISTSIASIDFLLEELLEEEECFELLEDKDKSKSTLGWLIRGLELVFEIEGIFEIELFVEVDEDDAEDDDSCLTFGFFFFVNLIRFPIALNPNLFFFFFPLTEDFFDVEDDFELACDAVVLVESLSEELLLDELLSEELELDFSFCMTSSTSICGALIEVCLVPELLELDFLELVDFLDSLELELEVFKLTSRSVSMPISKPIFFEVDLLDKLDFEVFFELLAMLELLEEVFFNEELEDKSFELVSFISISIFFDLESLEELELGDFDFFDVELDEE